MYVVVVDAFLSGMIVIVCVGGDVDVVGIYLPMNSSYCRVPWERLFRRRARRGVNWM